MTFAQSSKGNKEGLTKAEEIFVTALVEGNSQRQAYYKAYPNSKKWKEKTVDEKASKLFKQTKVRTRFDELMVKSMKPLEDKAVMTATGMVERLTKIADANIMDYIKVDTIELNEDGIPIHIVTIAPKDLDNVDMTAVKSIKVDRKGNLQLEMYDRLKAMEMISELRGFKQESIEAPKVEITLRGNIDDYCL